MLVFRSCTMLLPPRHVDGQKATTQDACRWISVLVGRVNGWNHVNVTCWNVWTPDTRGVGDVLMMTRGPSSADGKMRTKNQPSLWVNIPFVPWILWEISSILKFCPHLGSLKRYFLRSPIWIVWSGPEPHHEPLTKTRQNLGSGDE